MSSSSGRIMSRKIRSIVVRGVESPLVTLVEDAQAYLDRTDRIARWKNERAFNRTKTHRTVALKFVATFGKQDR